jgi:hypothetical protein
LAGLGETNRWPHARTARLLVGGQYGFAAGHASRLAAIKLLLVYHNEF